MNCGFTIHASLIHSVFTLEMNFNDESFSTLVCLAVLAGRKSNANALSILNLNSTNSSIVEFDSSIALSTLHTVRQVLRANFANRCVDDVSRAAIESACNSGAIVALYVGAMLSLLLAQHALDRAPLSEFQDLLQIVLLALQRHSLQSSTSVTPTTPTNHGNVDQNIRTAAH